MIGEQKTTRKRYVVDRRFQYHLISTFLISVLLALILFSVGFALYYWISSSVGDNLFKEFIVIHKQIKSVREVENEEGEIVKETFLEPVVLPPIKRINLILPPLLINNLIIMIVIIVFGIFFSHRIAGPTYRMMKDIRRALDGEYEARVHLRKKDSLHELADRINDLLDELEKEKNLLQNKQTCRYS